MFGFFKKGVDMNLRYFYLYVEFTGAKGLQSENVDVIASTFDDAVAIYRHTLLPADSRLCFVKERF